MRPGFELLALVLVAAVLGGLGELFHTALLSDVDRLLPAFSPFLHGGLVALVLAPLFISLRRQLHTTRRGLARAGQGEQLARSRIALIGEALRAGQFTVYEVDVEQGILRVLGGGGVIGQEEGDAPFTIDGWLARCHPDDGAAVREGYVALVTGATSSFETSYRRRGDDDAWRWVRVQAYVSVADATGRARRIVGTLDDVTAMKSAEQQLRDSSERFELALRGSSTGWWDWNLDTDEVAFSARYEELLGFAPEEFGKDFAAFAARLHPDEQTAIYAAIDDCRSGREELDVELRMRHHGGEWRWYRTRGTIVRSADGLTHRMAGTLADVSERKARELELAAARAQLSDAIESLDSAIVMFDAGQRLVFCNSRYRELYELTDELVVPGTRFSDQVAHFFARHPVYRRGRDPELHARALFARHRAGGRPWDFELGDRWLLVSERPTQDGGAVCLHTDVSRLKATQRALELALQRAEAANRAKSQFVANVSHELRTPLNAVLGMLQLMDGSALPAPQDEYVRVALQAGSSLLELIEDILDFSRNEAGDASVADEILNLPLLIDEIVAAHARRALAKGLALLPCIDPAVPERVHGDAARIAQVLGKLLGNAIKFTARGEVRVELRSDPQVPHGLRLVVADTGSGIAPELQARVFVPFTQGDGSHTRRHGGTGLGLALVRQQLELMGGSITLESAPGRGSRFDCRLALLPVAGAPSRPHTRALVIGPASPSRPALEACLVRAGCAPICVADVAAAVGVLDASPDLPVTQIFVEARLEPAALLRIARVAEARGLACTGYGLDLDAAPPAVLQPVLATLVRSPVSYVAVRAALQVPVVAARERSLHLGELVDAGIVARLAETLGAAGFEELLEAFEDCVRQRLADYRAALAARDGDAVRRTSHALKGVGANLGAARFAAQCADIGRRAALGEFDDRETELAAAHAAAVAGLRAAAADCLGDDRRRASA